MLYDNEAHDDRTRYASCFSVQGEAEASGTLYLDDKKIILTFTSGAGKVENDSLSHCINLVIRDLLACLE